MPELLGYQFDRTFGEPIERYRKVATTTERDAIPTGKRWEGMLCYVTSDTVDYQLRGGIANGNWVTANDGNYFDLSTNDSDDITEGTINLFLTAAERAKLAFIAITQAVDLDALETAVAALGSGVNFKGGWDASAGTFPGGGTAAIGHLYICTTAGTVDSISFAIGDGVIAYVTNASTTTYAGNWTKVESQSDVTSVIGLTGAITKSQLLSALNVEDGATADMTGAEISTAITTYLGNADWQAPLTDEQVEDVVGGLIGAGTQSNITVTYNDGSSSVDFTVPDFIQVYADLTNLIAGQGSQTDHYLYEVTDASGFTGITSGTAWVRWLGTTDGDEFDYMVVSAAENAVVPPPIPLSPYADDTALFAGQANQLTNYIYEVTDGSGFTGVTSGAIWVKYLGTTVGDETDYTIISKAEGFGSGTVTSVAQTVPTGFTVSGSPITTAGTLAIAYDTGYQGYTTTEATKLSGIEALADVTDATNVDAAGAVMNSDTSTASMSFVIDEDNMASDSATKVPTQQSVKAYVDASAGAALPVADTTAIVKGSADATKLVRFEVDGLTTGTTRVITVPDEDFTLNTIKSVTAGEISGSDQVTNVVSLTQAEYDAGSPNASTLYVITDAKEDVVLPISFSDQTTVITTGAAKRTFYMPFAMTVTSVRATLKTADNALFTVDINEGGTSILSTKLTIDSGEETSQTAATAAVISDSALADWAKITIDVDTAGTAAVGGDIYLIGKIA